MQLKGFCRFSWFGISDTGRNIQTEEDAIRILYDPARLASRFHLFENLCAPSMLHQTDPDFEFVVITSPLMPDLFMQRLERIVASVPQMRLLVTDQQNLSKVMHPMVMEGTKDGTVPMTSFRLDDDDAVSVNYIANLRRVSARMAPGDLISFPKGLYAFKHDHGTHVGDLFKAYYACGLARVNGPGSMRDVYRMQHMREYENSPSYVDPSFPAYLVTAHHHNISGIVRPDGGARMRNRYFQNTPELHTALWTQNAEAAIASEFPFLTPDAIIRIVDEADSIGFDPDRPLPDALMRADA